MEFWKKFVYFLLMPLMVPLALFMQLTFDWWAGLYRQQRRVLFFVLSPIYAPLTLIMNVVFGWWSKLPG